MKRLDELVRRHPALDGWRRAIRFWRQAPASDLRQVGRSRAIARARPFTMISYRPLASLWNLAHALEVPGAIVECGSCNGGSAAVLAAAAPDRPLWLFDSWEGLPEPAQEDIRTDGLCRQAGWNLGSELTVSRALRRVGASATSAHFVKGWFEDTLFASKGEIGSIALLHVDCDFYESVRLVLAELYDQIVPGGVIAIDDYHAWLGCRKAVDEFFDDVETLSGFERVGGAIRFRKAGTPQRDPTRSSNR